MADPLTSFLIAKNHPLRSALVDEMHVRRFPSFAAPMRMTQLLMFTGEESAAQARRDVESLCERFGVIAPVKVRYFHIRLDQLQFVWEHHTECSTFSFIAPGAFQHPFATPVLNEVPLDWLQSLQGQVLRATQVAVLAKDAADPEAEQLAHWFSAGEVMSCHLSRGEARVWSDFRLHDDGMGRLLIRDQGLRSAGDTARLVQRLQELGNYRNLALLGLPVVQEWSPKLTRYEAQLAEVTRQIATDGSNDAKLLEDLSVLSADIARVTAETRYRMSATRAYAQLVFDRLRSLEVERIAGYQTLIDFTERRLTPAVRTCESFAQRLEDLAQRASWASSLMRTRIETELERQNTALLESMNRGTHMQLRLQQTVEGLSVLAISYYFIGILGYVLKPATHLIRIDTNLILGALAPIVLLAVWYFMRRLRRSFAEPRR